MSLFTKIFGTASQRELKSIYPIADKVDALEEEYKALTDAQLQAKTPEFKARLANGETLDDILPEAFAAVPRGRVTVCWACAPIGCRWWAASCCTRAVSPRCSTGEGKTLVATLPAYLNALAGKGVHVVTVNDYLAKRDSEWMGKVYRFMGLTVGLIVHESWTTAERQAAYDADITYGTNNEFGFDYLRDNMAIYSQELVQRGHSFAIVDEVDSILIDEARTPLIISGQGEESTQLYTIVDQFVSRLKCKRIAKVDDEGGGGRRHRRRLCGGRKGPHRHPHRPGHPKGGGVLPPGEPGRPGEHHPVPPHQPGHQGPGRDEAGHRLCGQGRRGHHRGRVHRPSDVRPPVQRGPAPGHRGQGGRAGRPTSPRPWPPSPSRTISACTTSCPV